MKLKAEIKLNKKFLIIKEEEEERLASEEHMEESWM